MLVVRQGRRGKGGAGDADHTQTAVRHDQHLRRDGGGACRRQMAQIDDGLGRALRRHQELGTVRRLPYPRHGQHFPRQRIIVDQLPVGMQVLRICQQPGAGLADGRLHRIKRPPVACQDGIFEQAVQLLLQGPGGIALTVMDALLRPQTGHVHAVGRQRTRLVYAQHRRRAQ